MEEREDDGIQGRRKEKGKRLPGGRAGGTGGGGGGRNRQVHQVSSGGGGSTENKAESHVGLNGHNETRTSCANLKFKKKKEKKKS